MLLSTFPALAQTENIAGKGVPDKMDDKKDEIGKDKDKNGDKEKNKANGNGDDKKDQDDKD
jgi:hypothetical protein